MVDGEHVEITPDEMPLLLACMDDELLRERLTLMLTLGGIWLPGFEMKLNEREMEAMDRAIEVYLTRQ